MNTTAGKYTYRSVLGALMLASLVACEQPKTFVPGLTDAFVADTGVSLATASSVYQADYVFVLDYSWSMRNKREALANKLGNFVDALQSKDIDYRIGFVYGTAQGLGQYGSLSSKLDAIAQNFVAPFIDGSAGGALEGSMLDQVAASGEPNSPNTPVFLESSVITLNNEASSFLRAGSQLVISFISDRDDAGDTILNSNRTVEYYKTALKALKSSPSYISARAFVPGGTGCAVKSGDQAGTRLLQVAKGIDSVGADTQACVYDGEMAMLDELAKDVTKPTDRFALGSRPMGSTIEVRVDGVIASGWTYVSATNEIVFSTPPAPSSSIEIRYQIAFTLSRTPKVASIQVTLDGNAISQDATNGWSYVSAENRIQFHGSASPNDGSKILVTYEVQ